MTMTTQEYEAGLASLDAQIAAMSKGGVTGVTHVQANNEEGFSVTRAEFDGMTAVTAEPVIPDESQRPCFKVFDDWQVLPDGGKLRPGAWFFTVKHGKGDAPSALIQQWICSPLHVEAVTLDGQENNFGRMLRFKTTIGKWREWAMPMELLRGAGDELRGELLSMGVEIDPQAGRSLLGQYLQTKPPTRRVRCALQVGWCGDSFVLPDSVIGAAASSVIFQSGERGHEEYTQGGTLAGWQAEIAARAIGNPLLTLVLSASFVGPMLGRCNGESGGVHLVGNSSTGKTTAIEAACSAWGGVNYRRSWRATANGMEGAASLFNDGLLALDEISECDPKEIGAIVYALGNGRGKQRASRTGNARGVTRWRCFVLSSGERTIGTAMAEGGFRAKAGQSVRLLDIPAERSFGAWDNLHGLPNGAAFSDAIRRAAVTHHGHAGRVFLEKLTRDKRDFCDYLEAFKTTPGLSADDGEGQIKRAAGRFALLAMAGELAIEYGVTPWPEGAAIEAAAIGLQAWLSTRGRGNEERRQVLEQVTAFIERHGDSRFSDAKAINDVMRVNRAGWWRDADGGRVYLFNAEGMREAVKGFDFKRALDVLQESGALPGTGERAKGQRIDGRLVRLYPIQADKLGADHVA
jgi:putative DNA primase/helicase